MTGIAFNTGVRTAEGMLRVDIMIESRLRPCVRNMTGVAALAKMTVVIVIVGVAGEAGGDQLVGKWVFAMAVVARERRVLPGEIECRIARVIERGVEPPGWLVAVAAFRTAAALMRIVSLVAAVASGRRFQEGLVGVTAKAGGLFVFSDKAETGGVVIKRNLDPAGRRVAVTAGAAHRLTMNIVVLVAGKTL